MITLHESNSIDFLNNNGLGILKDCTSAEIVEEINGEFSITVEYPAEGRLCKELIEERIIVSEVGYGELQAFRIKQISETLKNKKIYATHIFYDLSDNLLEDIYPKNLNGNSALNWILSKTQYEHKFTGFSNVDVSKNARYVRKNVTQALIGNDENSFVNRWGGEIIRDNFKISIVNKRQHSNEKKRVIYRKNLKGITFNIDSTTIGTRLMPIGYDALMLPEKYIDSPLINNYPHPIIKLLEYSDVKLKTSENEEGFETLEEARDELRKLTRQDIEAGIDKPCMSTTIDFIKLSDTEEYKKYKNLEELYIGDSINVYIEKMNIDVEQRIVKTTYNPLTHKFTKYELGNVKTNYATQSVKNENKLQEITLPNLLAVAKTNATAQITSALGGYVYKTQSELFIMDTDDPNTAQKVWRWNLNGLGYSSTGINGEYGLAMTQDGKIVADFITTGTMSVARIKGLEDLLNGYSTQININSDSISQIVSKTETITKNIEEAKESIKENKDNFEEFINSTYLSTVKNLQNQIDGAIQFWNGTTVPTLNNYPAMDWKTEDEKVNHTADIYTVINDEKQGKSYRFDKVNGTWKWIELTDNEVSAIAELAQKAQSTADSKMKVFIEQPFPPYQIGDLWIKDEELYKCNTNKETGVFVASEWEKAVKYTDDATANAVNGKLTTTIEKVNSVTDTANSTSKMIGTIQTNIKTLTDNSGATSKQITEIKKSVETLQDNSKYAINIINKITEDGVTKLDTKTGYTFGEDGFKIDKTGAETKSKFDEAGMLITDNTGSSGERLLFAGYDKEKGETVVETKNLTVEKYFCMGKNLRVEDYQGGTGFFYTGEE